MLLSLNNKERVVHIKHVGTVARDRYLRLYWDTGVQDEDQSCFCHHISWWIDREYNKLHSSLSQVAFSLGSMSPEYQVQYHYVLQNSINKLINKVRNWDFKGINQVTLTKCMIKVYVKWISNWATLGLVRADDTNPFEWWIAARTRVPICIASQVLFQTCFLGLLFS